MVGHEDVGVNLTAKLVSELFEVVKIVMVVFFDVEAHAAIVTALDDVPGNAGER